MGRGIYEGSPRTERVQLETRSSDPSNPSNGEVWLRTDLTGTDKVAEYRWYDGASFNAVDVVTPGTTSSPVEEVLRVQTPNGKGVIKTAPRADATYPEQSLQHAGSPLGLGYSAIPDSVTDHWPMDEGSGTSIANVEGTVDITLNTGGTWEDNPDYTGGTAPTFDGTDDWWQADSQSSFNTQQYSVALWVVVDATDANSTIIATNGDSFGPVSENGGYEIDLTDAGEMRFQHFASDGTGTTILSFNTNEDGNWYFVGLAGDGDQADAYVYDSNGLVASNSDSGPRDRVGDDVPLQGMGRTDFDRYVQGIADDLWMSTTDRWSQSQFEAIWEETVR